MAAWQLDLHFLPRGNSVPDLTSVGWEPILPKNMAYTLQGDLAHYLGSPWLMLDDWLVFGPENGNRVDVLFEPNGDSNLSVRVDVRNDSPQFLVLVTDLARMHGCVLYSPDCREIVEPELPHVLSAIARKEIPNLDMH